MPVFLAFLLGIGFLAGGWFQLLWGDILIRDHLSWYERLPRPIRWLWGRRFDRAYAVITGSAFMMLGAAILVVTAVDVLN